MQKITRFQDLNAEKISFYYVALGSTSEVQNQLIINRDLSTQSETVSKLLNGLIRSAKTRSYF